MNNYTHSCIPPLKPVEIINFYASLTCDVSCDSPLRKVQPEKFNLVSITIFGRTQKIQLTTFSVNN